MITCTELAGKVIRDCTIYEDGSNSPEVLIEFTDDTTFSVCFRTSMSVDAKSVRDEGGEPQILKVFAGPGASR